MHVAILCEYGTVNGGENSILAAIEDLPEIEFSVIAPPQGRLAVRLSSIGVRNVPLSLHDADGTRLPRNACLKGLHSVVQSLRPDLLHANSLSMGRLTGRLTQMVDIPCTAHLRDILRLSPAAIDDLNANERLIAVSKATRDAHIAQGLNAGRTFVVYNGVAGSQFRRGDTRQSVLAELQIPAMARLVGTIGQIGLRKGWKVLVDAIVASHDRLSDVHFLLVGERFSQKHESIRYESELRERVTTAGIDDRVHWIGYRDDVPRLLNALDVLVHPALQEPLGRVLLEAAICGAPIIATDVGGTAEILTHRESAILIPPNDPISLANALIDLLDDEGLRDRFGRAARAIVEERFETGRQSQQLARHWSDVVRDA